ncbi:MAG: hypothetical protein GQ538_09965 [Xanthomonadales bacterium]|nr:hypothetical protein [Xanthomonadales bacterium]
MLSVMLSLVSISVLANDVGVEDRALFWSIQKDGKPAGYLLGTIHSEDPRVLDFSEDFLEKLRESNIFAMELVPDMATLTRLTEYMHYPPGTTLESVIGPGRYAALVSAMSVHKVPADFISSMKPWAAMMTLSTPPPETGFFMDLSISLRASGSGLQTIGLETLEQQLSFLQNMPMEMQLDLLDQAIAEFDQVQKAHDEMVDAYLKNNLYELQALSDEQLTGVSDAAGEYFMESGIRTRNLRMAESLWPYLDHNRVFIAVGALHLPGDDGLLNLLRRRGYELKPLKIPFSAVPGQ